MMVACSTLSGPTPTNYMQGLTVACAVAHAGSRDRCTLIRARSTARRRDGTVRGLHGVELLCSHRQYNFVCIHEHPTLSPANEGLGYLDVYGLNGLGDGGYQVEMTPNYPS